MHSLLLQCAIASIVILLGLTIFTACLQLHVHICVWIGVNNNYLLTGMLSACVGCGTSVLYCDQSEIIEQVEFQGNGSENGKQEQEPPWELIKFVANHKNSLCFFSNKVYKAV